MEAEISEQDNREPEPAPAAVQLAVVRRGEKPLLYHLEAEPLILGRAEEAGLRLDAAPVEPRHARLVPKGNGWQVVDLDSSSGTYIEGTRLPPAVVTDWPPNETLSIGPFFLRWRTPARASAEPAALAADAEPGPVAATTGRERIDIRVAPDQVFLEPGKQTTIQVELSNRSDRVDHFTVDLSGLPREWVSTSHEFLRITPGGEASLPITIHPPESVDTPPGDHVFRLTVTSSAQGVEAASVEGIVTIPTISALDATLAPDRWRHGVPGRIAVKNEGNKAVRLLVSGHDSEGKVSFSQRRALAVAPGREESISITAEAERRPFVVRQQILPFTISLQPEDADVRELAGELLVPPRISLGCLLVAVLPVIVVAVVLAGISLGLIAADIPGFGADEGFQGPLKQYIRSQWQQDLEITSLAGAEDVWLVVMSEMDGEVLQSWRAPAKLDQTFLQQQRAAGWAIADLSYGNERWLVVMSQETEGATQRWEFAPAFPEAFIEEQAEQGYALSDLAYGGGQWAVVMTQSEAPTAQRWHLAPEFPQAFVREQWGQGFAVSDVAYGADSWAVVVTEALSGTRQAWQTDTTFPATFVEQRWQEGYDIDEIAWGHGVWAVVMTRLPEVDRRQTWQAAETLR